MADGLSEVPAQGTREEAAVLHDERIVEAHRLAELPHVLLGRIRRQQHQRRIAGEIEDEEHDEGNAQQDQQRLGQATRQEDLHGARRRRATASICGVCGNMSTGSTHSSRYPWRTRSPTSRASVDGLHETYTIRAGPSVASALRALGWNPARGGSATTTSARIPSRIKVGRT